MKNLRWILYVGGSFFALVTALVVLLLLPPVQKMILLRALPDGASVERVQVGLRGGSLVELRMPLDETGTIRIPEASFSYRPMRMLTARTAHLSYLRARHITVELPAVAEVELVEHEPSEPIDLASAQRDLRGLLSDLEALRFKWVLGELAVDGTLLQPQVGLFRFELYGDGFAPGEAGRLRVEVEALQLMTDEAFQLAGFKSIAELQFAQSSEGAIEQLVAQLDAHARNQANRQAVTANAHLDFAFAGAQRRPQVNLALEADIPDTTLLGEPLKGFRNLGFKAAFAMDASDDVFVISDAQLQLAVDGESRVAGRLQQPLSIGEVLPAELELFRLEFKSLPLEWLQLLAADTPKLSGSPLSATLSIASDGAGGFDFSLPELKLRSLSLSDPEGDLLVEGLGMGLAMQGQLDPEGDFSITIEPLTLLVNTAELLQARLLASGNFLSGAVALEQSFTVQFDAIRGQPLASEWESFLPADWKLLQSEMQLNLDNDTFALDQLQAQLQTQDGISLFEVKLNQPIRVGLADFQMQVVDENMDLLHLRINGIGLAALQPLLPEGMALSGQDLRGELRIRAKGDGLLVNVAEPLQLAGLSIGIDGAPLLDQVDLSADLAAAVAPHHLRVNDLQLRMSSRGGVIMQKSFDLEVPLSDWQPQLEGIRFSGEIRSDLAALSRQPVIATQLQPMRGQLQARLNGAGLAEKLDVDLQIADWSGTSGALTQLKGDVAVQSSAEGAWQVVSQLDWGRLGADKRSSLNARMQIQQTADLLNLTGELNSPLLRMIDIQGLQAVVVPVADRPSAPATTPKPDADVFAEVPWAGLAADLKLKVDGFELPNGVLLTAIGARAIIEKERAMLTDVSARLGNGRAKADAKLERKADQQRFQLTADASFNDLEPGFLMGRPGTVQGKFDGRLQVRGQGSTPEAAIEAAEVIANIEGRDGLMTLLNLESPATGAAMIGLSLLGAQTRQPGIAAFSRAIPYFNQLRFNRFGLDLHRAADGVVELKELALVGPDLSVSGQGSIAAGKWQDTLNQPMRLSLDLGARGQLAESLQTLGLVRTTAGADGFNPATQSLAIGGTLARPDSRAVQDWLWQAAIGALTGGGTRPAATDATRENQTTPESPSRTDAQPRENRLPEELEAGRRLIEGLFGR